MAKDRDQKTEQQTAKRKKESRKKGQVAKSATLVSWLSLLLATFLLPPVVRNFSELISEGVSALPRVAADPNPEMLVREASTMGRQAIGALTPLLLGTMLLGILGNLAQVGLIFTTGPLKPKFERINPIEGTKRLFSTKSLWETGKQVVTMGVILAVSIPAVIGMANSLMGTTWALGPALAQLAGAIVDLVQIVAIIGCLIGVADFAWQRFNLMRDSKMTKQEVKQEARESDGDPHVKAKLRQNRMAMSRNRMLASVGDADVVITNPTHFAVALRYEPTKGAPRVLARGADTLAQRIRERALDAGVPIIESPPLARALHRSCRVDDEIPAPLFQAVATVLAYVHRFDGTSLMGSSATLHVPDSWTPPGEDPETSLTWKPTRRPPRRRTPSVPTPSVPTPSVPTSSGPNLISSSRSPIDPGHAPRQDAGRAVAARTPKSVKGS
jgi:flagellar biosynthetic protein FlhB